MDQASFQSFIRTIIIVILVYYLLKFAFKLLAPYLLKKAVDKVNHNFQQQQQAYQNQYTNNQSASSFNDDVKQNKVPKEKTKVGEYIDFEEIE